jgi:hypothetical protein
MIVYLLKGIETKFSDFEQERHHKTYFYSTPQIPLESAVSIISKIPIFNQW